MELCELRQSCFLRPFPFFRSFVSLYFAGSLGLKLMVMVGLPWYVRLVGSHLDHVTTISESR